MVAINEVVIVDEFLNLCIPLVDEELRQLKANILAEGFRDPLVVWKGHKILLDGHTRHHIWKSGESGASKPPAITEIELPSRDAAHDWVINNQLGRRNCTQEQKYYLRGKRLLAEKKRGGAPKGNKNAEKTEAKQPPQAGEVVLPDVEQKDRHGKWSKTSERLAKEYGVSGNTIERDALYAKVVDELEDFAGKESKLAVLSGSVHLERQHSHEFLKLDKKEKKKAAKMIAEQSVKSVGEAVRIVSGDSSVPIPKKNIYITGLQVRNLYKLHKEVKRLVDRPSSELSRFDINLKVDVLGDLISKIHSKLKKE